MNSTDEQQPVWLPNPATAAESHMQRFMDEAAAASGNIFSHYDQLYQWSLNSPSEFWSGVARYTGMNFSKPPQSVLVDADQMPGARWFVGAELNFAEHLLSEADERLALIYRDEQGRRVRFSRAELSAQVAALAAALRAAGVAPGDRVAAVLPNCPEAVMAMLAAASIGAVFTSCSPEFGADAILDRLAQIQPKILFGCDGSNYNGQWKDFLPTFRKVAEQLPSLTHIILVPRHVDTDFVADNPPVKGATLWKHFLLPGSAPEYRQLPFDHPLLILFSSGTTAKPKCIVHGAGGTLLQHLKELVLHTNLWEGDRIFYYTTCGWMMWNWLVSALAAKAAVLLYDGSPMYPDSSALWRLAAEEGINVVGTSPKYLGEFEKSGADLSTVGSLAELRTVLSTGAPLPPSSYDFVSRVLGKHVQLGSISGGTDIISCFALVNPLLPVWRGELQCRGLGMAVAVLAANGEPVRAQLGELVCMQPFPSMPLGFWNDMDGSNYSRAYFERYPDVWTHGDLAELTPHGGLIIHGRSDAVLNPGGVRIGSGEVCGPVQALAEVVDCIAISQRWQGDTRIVLFVVLQVGCELDGDLEQRLRRVIRDAASPRHVPAVIASVPEIPRTLSGKPVELAVRAVVHDEPVDNLHAIANPAALEHFRDRAELRESE
jgi:acetoacetyl-CoA synthetase